MARVVRFHRLGGPEVLGIEEVAVPAPGRGEVQIRVKALGLNRAEAMLRSGTYIETAPLPSGLGCEASGIVEKIGEGVGDLSPGDVVSVVPPEFFTTIIRFQASYTYCLPVSSVVMFPFASNVGEVAPDKLVISFCLLWPRV